MELVTRLRSRVGDELAAGFARCMEQGTLGEGEGEDEAWEPPADRPLQLYPHQKQAVGRMRAMEAGRRSVRVQGVAIAPRMGVYCDSVGTGKSFAILGLIASTAEFAAPDVPSRKRSRSLCHADVVLATEEAAFDPVTGVSRATLLVVPHNILRQWQDYLQMYTPRLRVAVFKRATAHRAGLSAEAVLAADVVLCQSNMYNECAYLLRDRWLRRVIWDEADSAPIPAASLVRASFYWLVTSSFVNLFYPSGVFGGSGTLASGYKHTGFIQDMIKFMRLPLHWPAYVVRNAETEVQRSFGLDDPEVLPVLCRPPQTATLARQAMMSDNVVRALDAGDFAAALGHLGFAAADVAIDEGSVQDLLCNAFASTLTIQIESHRLELDLLQRRRDARGGQLSESEQRQVARHTTELASLQGRQTSLLSRVQGLADELCLICQDVPAQGRSRVATACCQKLLCSECLCGYIRYRNTASPPCPNCRAPLAGIVFGEASAPGAAESGSELAAEAPSQLLSKRETVLRLVQERLRAAPAESRFLIFSEFDMKTYQDTLASAGVRSKQVMGHPTTIERTVQAFREGLTRVLFLNAAHYGAGLNLQSTTDIIVCHQMPFNLVQQVVGRAQRPGRTSRLRVHFLIHEGEEIPSLAPVAV